MAISLATLVPRRLADSAYITDSATAKITNASGKITIVTVIWLTNSHTSDIIVTLYRVPDSGGSVGTAGDSNRLVTVTVPAGETKQVEIKSPGVVLEDTNDTIQAVAATTNKVAMSADGFIADSV